jgi:diguanylate cyclase (GGDEF)-like protein
LSKVTDIYEKTKTLEAEVAFDSLTGVMRKKYFDLKLHHLMEAGTPFALAVVDIDDFKAINDRFGHQVGDAVLQEFVALLKDNTRDEDLIARWGGEEFLLAIRIDDLEKALSRIEAIRSQVDRHEFDTVGHLTASFGVAWHESKDDVDTMLQRADKALYKAKESGKNKVVLKKIGKLDK